MRRYGTWVVCAGLMMGGLQASGDAVLQPVETNERLVSVVSVKPHLDAKWIEFLNKVKLFLTEACIAPTLHDWYLEVCTSANQGLVIERFFESIIQWSEFYYDIEQSASESDSGRARHARHDLHRMFEAKIETMAHGVGMRLNKRRKIACDEASDMLKSGASRRATYIQYFLSLTKEALEVLYDSSLRKVTESVIARTPYLQPFVPAQVRRIERRSHSVECVRTPAASAAGCGHNA